MSEPQSGAAVLSDAERRLSIAAVIASITVFGLIIGLTYPLLSLILEARGVPTALIGYNASMTAVGILVSAPFMPRLARLFGVAEFMLYCLLATGVLLLALRAYPNIYVWFPLRALLGVAINGLFILSESWINEIADDRNRGKIVGLYAAVLSAGFGLGPLIIPLVGTQGWTPFVAGAALVSVAIIPVLYVRRLAPRLTATGGASPFRFFVMAPIILFAVAVFSLFDSTVMSLLPLYALDHGLGETKAVLIVAALILGNVVLQVPVGWLADRYHRYAVLLLCGVAGTAGAALLPLFIERTWALWPFLVVWGGLIVGIYTVALALLGARFKGNDLIAGNAAFSLAWGLGSIIGPAVGGQAMTGLGPEGLPLVIGTACALFVAATLWRRGGDILKALKSGGPARMP